MKAAVLAFAAASATALPAHADPGAFTSSSQRLSPAHPRVILAPRSAGRAAMRIQLGAGSFDDGDRGGLTRLALHAMVSASAHEPYGRFALDLFRSDATVSIETGVRESAVVLEAPAEDFEGLARRLVKMCLAPRLAPAALDDAMSRTVSDGGELGVDALAGFVAANVFSEPEYANSPYGTKHTVRAITAAEIRAHFAGPLAPAGATVVVAGGFDPARMRAILAGVSGGAARSVVRSSSDLAGSYRVASAREMHLVAYPMKLAGADSIAAAHLMSAIAEEHLVRGFRKIGFAYSAGVVPVRRSWLDFLLVILPIGDEALGAVGKRVEDDIASLAGEGLTERAFQRNRASVLAALDALDRDPVELAASLGMGTAEVEWLSPRVVERIEKMTRASLQEIAGRWIAQEHAVHVELSPRHARKPPASKAVRR